MSKNTKSAPLKSVLTKNSNFTDTLFEGMRKRLLVDGIPSKMEVSGYKVSGEGGWSYKLGSKEFALKSGVFNITGTFDKKMSVEAVGEIDSKLKGIARLEEADGRQTFAAGFDAELPGGARGFLKIFNNMNGEAAVNWRPCAGVSVAAEATATKGEFNSHLVGVSYKAPGDINIGALMTSTTASLGLFSKKAKVLGDKLESGGELVMNTGDFSVKDVNAAVNLVVDKEHTVLGRYSMCNNALDLMMSKKFGRVEVQSGTSVDLEKFSFSKVGIKVKL